MIGEIRDGETAQIAVRAAITGHLVLSTMHTNDAASTVSDSLIWELNHIWSLLLCWCYCAAFA
jgi:Tfp pilus assembly ATPase PilU